MKNGNHNAGFTLVEVMVASAISLMLTALVISGAVYCWRVVRSVALANEMKQNVRMALDLVSRDVRNAGYGVEVPDIHLPLWFDWIGDFESNPTIRPGADGGPDTLLVASVYDVTGMVLSASAASGDTVLQLSSGGSQFNTTTRKIIYVGRAETARIVSRSGDTLTVSTHPTASSGLQYDHPAGAPVELVQVMTTSWAPGDSGYPNQPHLQRELSGRTYSYSWQKFAAGHIEDFRVWETNGLYTVSLTGRAAREEQGYTHPEHGDGFRRYTLQSTLRPRN